jgi:hypothetical protein
MWPSSNNKIGNGARTKSYITERILAGLIALPLTTYALSVIRNQWCCGIDVLGVSLGSAAGMIAFLCWWFVIRAQVVESRTRMRSMLVGGSILGGIGLMVGFIGPLVLAPGANQGPLLGLVITGPLGFVVGAVIGWVYASANMSRA